MSEVNGSPVGLVAEINGLAHVSHPDGTQETMSKGNPCFKVISSKQMKPERLISRLMMELFCRFK